MTLPSHSCWVAGLNPESNSRMRLFCFPYAGSGAGIYRNWQNLTPPELHICPVLLPGREKRIHEKPFHDIQQLVSVMAEELSPRLDAPFAFFGHSMGALIAFELMRQLRREGKPLPIHLFASAHRAPDVPKKTRILHKLPDDQFILELRRLQGTPEEVLANEELMALFIPLLRADFQLLETYRFTPEEPFSIPMTVFGAREDSEVSEESLLAWQNHTTQFQGLHWFPGGHFYLHQEQRFLAGIITRSLGFPME